MKSYFRSRIDTDIFFKKIECEKKWNWIILLNYLYHLCNIFFVYRYKVENHCRLTNRALILYPFLYLTQTWVLYRKKYFYLWLSKLNLYGCHLVIVQIVAARLCLWLQRLPFLEIFLECSCLVFPPPQQLTCAVGWAERAQCIFIE